MLAQKVSATIHRHGMFDRGARLLVGLSGGADSVALAHLLRELSVEIVLAHLDHGLRDDSRDDAVFCRRIAEQLCVPLVTERVEVASVAKRKRLSIEDAGRRARYAFFRRQAERHGCERVAVAHTMDDQAETVLMRLVRGSGTAGLSGIPLVRGAIVRPLIELRRHEIEAYLRERGLDYREDPSNRDLRFARNRTRHQLIPALEQGFNPRVTETLSRTAELLREDEAWMESMARETADRLLRTSGGNLALSAHALAGQPRALARRVVRRAVGLARGTVDDLEMAHVEDVLDLAASGTSGKELHLPGLVVARDFDQLRFSPGSGRNRQRDTKRGYNGYEYRLPIPAELRIPESAGTLTAGPFGLVTSGRDRGEEPTASGNRVVIGLEKEGKRVELSVRSPRRGDRFRPLGAPGSKPLTRYLMERKVSREHRQSVPLLVRAGWGSTAGRSDEILWVVGHGISETARQRQGGEALELRWVSE